jgi:hypothetical protein
MNNWHGRDWGRHIRSSQPDPELLQKVEEFVPSWKVFSGSVQTVLQPVEFYDVIEWLKVSFRTLEASSHSFVDIPQPSTQLD